MVAENNDQVASCREAKNPNAMGIEFPLNGVRTGDSHGLLRVFKVGCVVRKFLFQGDAVLDERAVDSDGVEPGADFGAFEIVGKNAVASAGKDDDGGTSIVSGQRGIEGKIRLPYVGKVHERLAGNQAVCGFGDIGLRTTGIRLRVAAGPEGERDLLRVGKWRDES
jgi:hypothetical protein